MDWKNFSMDGYPAYDKPIILCLRGTIQHITYKLDEDDDSIWLESVCECGNIDEIWPDDFCNDSTFWIYVDDIPKPKIP